MSPVVAPLPAPVAYCSDAIPSNMAANFRNYMTHLSQLSPDHDNSRTPLFEQAGGVTRLLPGNEPWVEKMYLSGSDSEDCEMRCDYSRPHNRHEQLSGHDRHRGRHGDEHGCEVHSRSHGRRNPHFPYESFGTPRVAWGETPREAWSEPQDDPLYDSMNPYALFNLPKANQRGKRKQKNQTCTCQSRNSERSLDNAVSDTLAVSRIAENRRAAVKPIEHYNHNNSNCNPMIGPINRDSHSINRDSRPMEAYDSADRYAGSLSSSPQPSTSVGVIEHTANTRRVSLKTSKSLPIFSSQESMDTDSETGDSSDTDVDIVQCEAMNHSTAVPITGCDVNNGCSNCGVHGQSSTCNHKSAQRIRENTGVIRPKAIKLESGHKFHTCEPRKTSALTLDTSNNSIFRNQVSGAKTCIHSGADSEQFPSSESRVLQMSSGEGATESSQPSIICENRSCAGSAQKSPTSSKSIKDLQNSVIRERFFRHPVQRSCDLPRNSEMESDRSIDLTAGDSDESISQDLNVNDNHSNENRTVSPVISEVHLPSASDDSDIEVVKIETNR